MDNTRLIDLSVCHEYTYTVEENTQTKINFLCTESVAENNTCTFILKKNSTLRVEFLLANVSTTLTMQCIMEEENSYAEIYGVYVVRDAQRIAINTHQNHYAPYSTSKIVVRGVLYDNAQSAYKGMIKATKTGTSALQENKNIVLSKNAHVVSVPQLEVTASDVKCFHASAIGRFDKEHLFYMACRGLNSTSAEQLLLHGFFSDMFTTDTMTAYLKDVI